MSAHMKAVPSTSAASNAVQAALAARLGGPSGAAVRPRGEAGTESRSLSNFRFRGVVNPVRSRLAFPTTPS
jgi:hypothetical protein